MGRITTHQGFVNATHLRRHRLHWDEDAIIDLIARRIVSNSIVSQTFRLNERNLKTKSARLATCSHILPAKMEGTWELSRWISTYTVDARRNLNPRNVISLLIFARKYQLESYDRDDPTFGDRTTPLIHYSAMRKGFAELSRTRLEDTVLAEFPSLRPAVNALRRRAARFPVEDLAKFMQVATNSASFTELLKALEYAGLIEINSTASTITLGRLYWPGLEITHNRQGTLSDSEYEELLGRVDASIDDLLAGKGAVSLRQLDTVQRKFVHNYVRERYPGFTTDSIRGNRLWVEGCANHSGDLLIRYGFSDAILVSCMTLVAVRRALRYVRCLCDDVPEESSA